MARTDFTFKRKDGVVYTLSTNNGFMVYKGEMTLPQLRVEEHKVDGRHGLLHSTSDDYAERNFTIPCVFKSHTEANSLYKTFNGIQGEIKFSYSEGWYKVSRVVGVYLRDAKGIPEIDILLSVSPFAFLDKVVKETSSTNYKFNNTTGEVESECVVSIIGSGNGTVNINGKQWTCTGLTSVPLIVDTELGEVTRNGVNSGELLEGNTEDVKIKVGENTILFTGGVQKVKIEFRPKLFR